jgi:methyl-accepting chemotaxis protein
MGRTSLKNKIILSCLVLLLLVMVVVGVVHRLTNDFFLAQAISTSLALVAGIIFSSLFSKSLVNRLKNFIHVAREISDGDLSRDIPVVSRDELRDLEEIFRIMQEELRAIISDMKEVASQVQKTNENLSALVKKVVTISRDIDSSAKTIAKGSEKQTLIVHKTSMSLENSLNEMDDMVAQSSEIVSKAEEARKRTEAGEAKARETLSQLDDVLQQMSDSTKPIFKLATKVERIKMIINVIDSIAQKTDLLSLNASIEATRAGETGKGFALVADEIRTMAENSKRSSQDIRKMVEDILEDNEAVTMSIRKSHSDINQGRETIRGIANTFAETLDGVNDISDAIGGIEQVTGNTVRKMRGLMNHFQELSRLANDNFLSTQKTTVATKSQKDGMARILQSMTALNTLSAKMMDTQKRFRLHPLPQPSSEEGIPES